MTLRQALIKKHGVTLEAARRLGWLAFGKCTPSLLPSPRRRQPRF